MSSCAATTINMIELYILKTTTRNKQTIPPQETTPTTTATTTKPQQITELSSTFFTKLRKPYLSIHPFIRPFIHPSIHPSTCPPTTPVTHISKQLSNRPIKQVRAKVPTHDLLVSHPPREWQTWIGFPLSSGLFIRVESCQ